MCRESGKTRFVKEASALNLPEYQVYKDQLARVYTEAVFASQAGAQQRPRSAQTGGVRLAVVLLQLFGRSLPCLAL